MSEFKIGDVAWYVQAGPTEVYRPCRACAGKKAVVLILGTGEHVQLECEACRKGFDDPTGTEIEYKFQAIPKRFPITSVERVETDGVVRVTYRSGNSVHWSSMPADRLFTTSEEAVANSAQLVAAHEAEVEKQMALKVQNTNKSYAWNAAYHLREAEKAEKSAAHHSRKAILLKAKEPSND